MNSSGALVIGIVLLSNTHMIRKSLLARKNWPRVAWAGFRFGRLWSFGVVFSCQMVLECSLFAILFQNIVD